MYYMIKHNVLFRKYNGFGYLTDNSLFGYRKFGDELLFPGERYVSESGAMMLGELSKIPRHIDTVARRLVEIYEDVNLDVLKRDAIDFYNRLVDDGFLSCGTTREECLTMPTRKKLKTREMTSEGATLKQDCPKITAQSIRLKSLHIELVTECNERCIHCYIPHKYKTHKINPGLLFRLLNEARTLNVLNITLSGGEPFLHEDFCKILAQLREFDMSVNVLTNLTLLTDAIAMEMKENPLLSVQTSIYSMSPEIHDAITGVKGSLEKTLQGLKILKSIGIPMQISCPIIRQNKDSFASVVVFGKQNGIKVSTDFVIFASYDHSRCNLNNRLSLDDIPYAFDKRATDEYVHDLRILASEKEHVDSEDPVCSVCRYYMCISAEGKVYPCVGWQGNTIGDANRQKLKEIWEKSDTVQNLRRVTWANFPKCIDCGDKGFCNVCMMANANEDKDANPFNIDAYHCKVASLLHRKVDSYRNNKVGTSI